MNKVYVGFYGTEMPELILYIALILDEMNIRSSIVDLSLSQELLSAFCCDEQKNNINPAALMPEYGPFTYKNTVYIRRKFKGKGECEENNSDNCIDDAEIILINYGFTEVTEDSLSVLVIVTDEMLHHIRYIERLPVREGKIVEIVVKESVGYSGALLKVRHLSEELRKQSKRLRVGVIKLNRRDRKLSLLSVYNETFGFKHLSYDYKKCLDEIVDDIMCERGE